MRGARKLLISGPCVQQLDVCSLASFAMLVLEPQDLRGKGPRPLSAVPRLCQQSERCPT